ncbi:MAG: Asr1405/Asl0597 family protein [Cyanobacteria bacterium J06621_11]
MSSEMSPEISPEVPSEITVVCEDRWQVYYRLQALGIDCQCSGFKPLKVALRTPTEALQLWSVVRSISQPKQVLINSIQQSWQAPAAKR